LYRVTALKKRELVEVRHPRDRLHGPIDPGSRIRHRRNEWRHSSGRLSRVSHGSLGTGERKEKLIYSAKLLKSEKRREKEEQAGEGGNRLRRGFVGEQVH